MAMQALLPVDVDDGHAVLDAMEASFRKQLKDFQRAFVAQHGRAPSKSDMAKEPAIQAVYDAWHALRAASGSTASTSTSKRKAAASTGSQKHSQDDRSAGSAVLVTPRRNGKSTAATMTPTHAGSARKKANPFATPSAGAATTATPVKTPQRSGAGAAANRPPTPATVVKLFVTPPHAAAAANAGLDEDADFDYANSPSRLKALIKARASPRTARTEASTAALAYTPRTKARKRLRGEYLPPTPAVTTRTKEVEEEEDEEDEDAPEGLGRPLKRRRDDPSASTHAQSLLRPGASAAARAAVSKLPGSLPATSSFKRSITAPASLSSSVPSSSQGRQRVRGAFLAELELDFPTPPPSDSSSATKLEHPGQNSSSASGSVGDGIGTRTGSLRRSTSRASAIFTKGSASQSKTSEVTRKGKGVSDGDAVMKEASPSRPLAGVQDATASMADPAQASPPRKSAASTTGPRWTLSQIEVSEDDETDATIARGPSTRRRQEHGSEAGKAVVPVRSSSPASGTTTPRKTNGTTVITLAPYLRYGTARSRLEEEERRRAERGRTSPSRMEVDAPQPSPLAGASGSHVNAGIGEGGADEGENEGEEEEDEGTYAMPFTRLFSRVRSDPFLRAPPSPTATEAEAQVEQQGPAKSQAEAEAKAKAALPLPMTKLLTAQNRLATHAQRARSRAMIRALLGEMEELDLDSERRLSSLSTSAGGGGAMASASGASTGVGTNGKAPLAPAKNWGQAKEMNAAAAGLGSGGKGRKGKKGKAKTDGSSMETAGEGSGVSRGTGMQGTASTRPPVAVPRLFTRIGRAGVAVAEMGDFASLASDSSDDEGEEEMESEAGQEADESSVGSRSDGEAEDGLYPRPAEEEDDEMEGQEGERGRPSILGATAPRRRRIQRGGSGRLSGSALDHEAIKTRGGRRHRRRQRVRSDEDWDSEIGSDEYGLGDGQMDAADVI